MDANAVFACFERLSDLIDREARLRTLRAQINRARTTCGSCSRWMTNACPRERHDNRAGRKFGPSGGDAKCDQFAIDALNERGALDAESQIAAMTEAKGAP